MSRRKNRKLDQFFELQKKSFDKCLHVGFDCQLPPIRAHSIQNAKVLDLLQEKNHVLMPQPKITGGKDPAIVFKSVGRNSASTFTGLCGKHDAELFKLVDIQPLDISNVKQLEQLAYRAVMRELHTCIEGGYRLQLLHQHNVRNGIEKANCPTSSGMAAIAFMEKAWRVFRYRGKNFDLPMLEKRDLELEHYIVEFRDQIPTVAVSSLFSVLHDKDGDIIGPALNVLPVDEHRTVAVASYPKSQGALIKANLADFFNAPVDQQRNELSKLIIQRVENFALSPTFYAGWCEEKKREVIKYFEASMMSPAVIPDHIDVLLF